MGTPIREEITQGMFARTNSALIRSKVVVDRFDRVGIVLISDKALYDGITHDTVEVVVATPYGLRLLTLQQILDQSEAVAVRPMIFPGDPKRSADPTPHPMKKASTGVATIFSGSVRKSGSAQTNPSDGKSDNPVNAGNDDNEGPRPRRQRSNSEVNFAQVYALNLDCDPHDPAKERLSSNPAVTRRRELTEALRNATAPLINKTFDHPDVMYHLATVFGWFARRLLEESEPSQDEMLRIDELVHQFCRQRAITRKETYVEQELENRRLRYKLDELTTLELKTMYRENIEPTGCCGRGDEERLSKTARRTLDLLQESRTAAIDSVKISAATEEKLKQELKEIADSLPVEAFEPQKLFYSDLIGLLAFVCSQPRVRCLLNDEEMYQLIEMFLDPHTSEATIPLTEAIRVWVNSLHRSAEFLKRFAFLLSGGVVSYLLQSIGILAEGEENLFTPNQFFQGSKVLAGALRGPMLGRESTIPLPDAHQDNVLDWGALRQQELDAEAKRISDERRRRIEEARARALAAEKQRREEERLRALREAEAKRAADAEALAERMRKEAEERALAEQKAREEEMERNRRERQLAYEAEKARRKAEREARQKGMSAIGKLLDLNDEEEDGEDEERAVALPSAGSDASVSEMMLETRAHHGKRFTFDAEPVQVDEEAAKALRQKQRQERERLHSWYEERAARAKEQFGSEKPVIVSFSASNLPDWLEATLESGSTFATMCVVWSVPRVVVDAEDDAQPSPKLISYTLAVRDTLNPDYQTACMLGYNPDDSNLFDVSIYLADSPGALSTAVTLGRARIDLLELLKAGPSSTQQIKVFDTSADAAMSIPGWSATPKELQPNQITLSVKQFSEDMAELVLFLGSDSQLLDEEATSTLCTYDGLEMLLEAGGNDIGVSLELAGDVEDDGVQFKSLPAAAFAMFCKGQDRCDWPAPAKFRKALAEFLSTESVSKRFATGLKAQLTADSPVTSKILGLCSDVQILLTRLCAIASASGDQIESSDDLIATLQSNEKTFTIPSTLSGSFTESEARTVALLLRRIVLTGAEELVSLSQTQLGDIYRVGGHNDTARAISRLRVLEQCGFRYTTFQELVESLAKV